MSDSIKRIETTHIDEVTRTAVASTQWFAEKLNIRNTATHPITHNNKLRFFICGQEGFADSHQDAGVRARAGIRCCG